MIKILETVLFFILASVVYVNINPGISGAKIELLLMLSGAVGSSCCNYLTSILLAVACALVMSAYRFTPLAYNLVFTVLFCAILNRFKKNMALPLILIYIFVFEIGKCYLFSIEINIRVLFLSCILNFTVFLGLRFLMHRIHDIANKCIF